MQRFVQLVEFLFIYIIFMNEWFTQDSLFNSNGQISMRVLPSLRNTHKGAYVELAMNSDF